MPATHNKSRRGKQAITTLTMVISVRQNPIKHLLFCLVLVGISQASHAQNIPQCGKSKFSDLADLVEKVSVIGSDDRKTFEAYAIEKKLPVSEVERRFGATGIVDCGNQTNTATAQLTGNNSVITTAAHTFYDANCNLIPIQQCTLYLTKSDQYIPYPLSLNTLRKGECKKKDENVDWAVIELVNPVPATISPYGIPESELNLQKGSKLIEVAGYSDNFKKGKNAPRYITECEILDVRHYDIYPLQTDCDTGHGASGSAQLVESHNNLVMTAMDVAETTETDGLDYNRDKVFNISIPLSGPFLQAVRDAVARTSGRIQAREAPTGDCVNSPCDPSR